MLEKWARRDRFPPQIIIFTSFGGSDILLAQLPEKRRRMPKDRDSALPLCTELGIDEAQLRRRLAWLGMDDAAASLLGALDGVLAPALPGIVEELHVIIAGEPELARLLPDSATRARVKAAQLAYFRALTSGRYDLPHAEQRLRVGYTHARIGLTPSWFLGAYHQFATAAARLLEQLLGGSSEHCHRAREALDKAIYFDLGLALEAYYHAARSQTENLARYFGEVLDQIPAGVLVLNAQGQIRSANLTVRRQLEIASEVDLKGSPASDWLALPGLGQAVVGLANGESAPVRFELQKLGTEGQRHFHVSATAIELDDEQHALVVLQDISRLRRAQDELRRFRTAIDASADAIFLIDRAAQRIIDINETASRLYGYPRREMIGHPLADFHQALDEARQESLLHHLESGAATVETTESAGQRRNGEVFPVELDLCLAYFGSERIVVVVARDISERRSSEQRLRRLHRRFRDLVTLSSDWFWEQDAQLRFVAFSPSEDRQAIGTEDRSVLGQTRWEMPHVVLESADWSAHRAALADHEPFRDFSYAVRDAKGNTRWVSASGVPLYDEDGSFSGYYGTAQDITELRRAERDLAWKSAELESILHNALVGIVFVAQGRVLRANRKAAELLGSPLEDLQDRPADLVFGRETLEALETRTPEGVFRSEIRLRRGQRGFFWANVSATLLKAEAAEAGAIWVIEDITARREAEEAVRRAQGVLEQRVAERTEQLQAINQELESFSYSVSHDLRAPLRAINGFSEILSTRYADALDETGLDYLRRVRAAAQRMDQQIEGLLQLSRVSQTPLDRQEIDLSAMAQEIVAELARAEPQRQCEVLIAPHLKTTGDRALLQIVIQNLLGNAWKYTQRRELAHIRFAAAQNDAGETIFEVSDDGAGFDMAHAERLFGAFQRLHRPDDFPGHGIGLATTKRIITRHGGRIWAESAVDRGASFFFTLT